MSRHPLPLGRFSAGHPWRALGLWALAAPRVGLAAVAGARPRTTGTCPAPGPAGHRAAARAPARRRQRAAQVVVHDDGAIDPGTPAGALRRRPRGLDHVLSVSPPRMSEDGDTALVTVGYDVPVTDRDLMGKLEPLEEAVGALPRRRPAGRARRRAARAPPPPRWRGVAR